MSVIPPRAVDSVEEPQTQALIVHRRSRRAREEPRDRSSISVADLRSPRVRGIRRVVIASVLALLFAISAGPLLWLAKASVSTTADINADPLGFWPSGIQWQNLGEAWDKIGVGRFLLNSILITTGEVVVAVVVSTTAAYVIAILRPRYAKLLSGYILAILFIPGVVSLVPLYLTVIDLKLLDTYWAVWLPNAVSAFSVLIIATFFRTIPAEIFEAARVDGAGPFRILISIVLPLSRPILGVVALLAFTASWKDFLWPLLALPSTDLQPLSVALAKVAPTADQALLLAGMFVTVLVPLLLFIVFQRQFLKGAGAAGAVKG